MADATRKTCSRCRDDLPASEFHKNSRHPSGLQTYCKACSREKLRENRAKNPERTRAQGRENMRRRRERDPQGVIEYQRRWRADNPDKIRESKTAWNQANYAKMRLHANRASRKWKAANPVKVRRGSIAWAVANPDKVATKSRKWRDSHPIKVRAARSRRRALIRSTSIGAVDLDLLWVRQCAVCALCNQRIDHSLAWPEPMSRSVDHIVPLSKGGTHEQANLAWTHLVCNLKKGAKAP